MLRANRNKREIKITAYYCGKVCYTIRKITEKRRAVEQVVEIEYAHNSTATEGNPLSLIETKVLLEDGISIGGKNLREIYEVVNYSKAFRYVKTALKRDCSLIKDCEEHGPLPHLTVKI